MYICVVVSDFVAFNAENVWKSQSSMVNMKYSAYGSLQCVTDWLWMHQWYNISKKVCQAFYFSHNHLTSPINDWCLLQCDSFHKLSKLSATKQQQESSAIFSYRLFGNICYVDVCGLKAKCNLFYISLYCLLVA